MGYLFVDTSYVIFYKMYATLAWFSFSKTEITEIELILRFTKAFEKAIFDLQKAHCVDWKDIVFAKDTPRGKIWRMELFPQYKACRDNIHHEYAGLLFAHTYNVIIIELRKLYGCKLVSVFSAEADDVIAVGHKMVRVLKPTEPITIITNDNDYLQLVDEMTKVVNLKNLELKSRVSEEVLKNIVQIKAICGDKSDNIPSIAPKIGEKTALKMVMNKELLEKTLRKDIVYRSQYEMNCILVDFDKIPEDVVKSIEAAFIEEKVI